MVKAEDLFFKAGSSFSSASAEYFSGLGADCFSLRAPDNDSYETNSDESIVVFNRFVQTNIFLKCFPSSETGCQISCIISFAEALESGVE